MFVEGLYTKKTLQLFDQPVYLKKVSYINPIFPLWFFHNIFTMVQNFQTLFENFALVNMSKLVVSKTDISNLQKRTCTCTFQVVRNFVFTVDWFCLLK